MGRLSLWFLGPPRIERSGTEVKLRRRKAVALLAYLAATGRRHSRDSLAELLYPGLERERAYSDFRQLLSMLKDAIGTDWLDSDRDAVGLPTRAGLMVDVVELRRIAAALRGEGSADTRLLRKAADLACGPFLSGFYLKDSTQFEDWQAAETESLRRDEAFVLDRLAVECETRGEPAEAADCCRRLVLLDPLDEAVHRRLMRALARSGQPAAALAQYERCKAILKSELGEEPGRETEALRTEITANRKGRPRPQVPARPPAPGSPFIGRESELRRITESVTAIDAGGRLFLVVGEAGVGKTRLLEEVAPVARSSGCLVLQGRCHDDRGLPAYWPWRELLRQLALQSEPARVRQWAGRHDAVLADAFDDFRGIAGDPSPPVRLYDPDSERFRLQEAVAVLLREAARERPLVLFLEDLHWADQASLDLLEFIARGLGESRIVVAATCRDAGVEGALPLAETLGKLARERSFERLDIDPLDRAQVEALVRASSAESPDHHVIQLLWEKTRGSPLFVVEYLRSLKDRARGSEVEIPPNIKALIRGRLLSLTAPCRDVLEVAAALGPDGSADLLGRATGLHSGDLLPVLKEAVTAGMLIEEENHPGSYRFSHPLVQEAIATGFSSERRAGLHARIVEILEALYGTEKERHATELANHSSLGWPLVPAEKLSRYSLLAGHEALANQDSDEALAHFARGLEAKAHGEGDAETAWLRFGAATAIAQRSLFLDEAAVAEHEAAFDYFVRVGDVASAVRVAGLPAIYTARLPNRQHALLDRALKLVRQGSAEEASLLWLRGMVDWHMGHDVGSVTSIIERSLKQAREQADRPLERRILLMWAYFIGYSEPLDVVDARVGAALKLLANDDDPKWEMNMRLRAYHVALARGNVARAQAHIDAFTAASRRMRSLHQVKLSLLMCLEFAMVQGAWDKARLASDEALQIESRSVLDWQMPALRARLELELGNAETARPYLDRCLGEAESADSVEGRITVANSLTAIARLKEDGGILALARTAVAPFAPLALGEAPPRMPLVLSSAVVSLTALACLEEDLETARKLRPQVAERHDLWFPGFEPTKPRLLGLLDMTLGYTDSAVANLTDSLPQYRAGGQKPAVAWTCSEVAEALLRRGRVADRRKAVVFLREAHEIARSLGMKALLERIDRLSGSA